MASEHTDGILEAYNKIYQSRNGKYINSDLMKMVYPFYAKNLENRKKFNLSITNSAAVLTNEAYRRAILKEDVKRCIFIVGPYGAGKSYFAQSLFEYEDINLKNSIIYEGSITPPAFDEKVEYAIQNNVLPDIIVLNPSLELSIRNIRERAKRIGRDVEKNEIITKFSTIYEYLKALIEKYNGKISYTIYNKENNKTIDLNGGTKNLEDLNHGTMEEISYQYDVIEELLKSEGMEHNETELADF